MGCVSCVGWMPMHSTSRPKASHRQIGSRYDDSRTIHHVRRWTVDEGTTVSLHIPTTVSRCSILLCGASCTCGMIAGWGASLTPPRTIPRTSTSFRPTTSYPSPKVHVQIRHREIILRVADCGCMHPVVERCKLWVHASCVGLLMNCAVWLCVQAAGLAGSKTSGDYPLPYIVDTPLPL